MFGPALDPSIIVPRSPRVIMNVCGTVVRTAHGTRHAAQRTRVVYRVNDRERHACQDANKRGPDPCRMWKCGN